MKEQQKAPPEAGDAGPELLLELLELRSREAGRSRPRSGTRESPSSRTRLP